MLFPVAKTGFDVAGGVIHVTIVLQSIFLLYLKQKKEAKKNSRLTFSPTRFLHFAKGQKLATLKQSALLNATLRALA